MKVVRNYDLYWFLNLREAMKIVKRRGRLLFQGRLPGHYLLLLGGFNLWN